MAHAILEGEGWVFQGTRTTQMRIPASVGQEKLDLCSILHFYFLRMCHFYFRPAFDMQLRMYPAGK